LIQTATQTESGPVVNPKEFISIVKNKK